jgi:hypothetical protein
VDFLLLFAPNICLVLDLLVVQTLLIPAPTPINYLLSAFNSNFQGLGEKPLCPIPQLGWWESVVYGLNTILHKETATVT